MRLLITKVTVLMLMILVSSCNEEVLIPTAPSTNEATVRFTLPNRSSVEVGAETRASKNELETKISNLVVFAVEVTTEGETTPADDAQVLERYTELVDNGGVMSTSIKMTNKPCWLIAVVNTSNNPTASTFNDIKNLSGNLTSLYSTSNTVGTTYANSLPMYGQQYFEKIEGKDYSLDLAHICARIDVESTAPNYVIETITLLNGANKGYFAPRSTLEEHKVGNVTEYKPTIISETPSVYLYENGGGTEDSRNYTDLVIGGKYTVSEGNILDSYIKVKLEYGSPLTADILRNTLYKLNVKAINNSNIGHKTFEDAKKGEYSDAEIDIEVGPEALSDLTVGNGDYYMSFSNSEFRAYIPAKNKMNLVAFTMRYDKNSTSNVDLTQINKELIEGADNTGIFLLGIDSNKPTNWKPGTDINILVHLDEGASGSIIVRIGNLVKEIKVVREEIDTNLSTAFNDDNYVHARFVDEAPSWLKIATKNGTPEVVNSLHSNDGFTFEFEKDIMGSESTELYLTRSSEKGRTKVYMEQYVLEGDVKFTMTGVNSNTIIHYEGQDVTTDFRVTASTATLHYLDGEVQTGDAYWRAEYSLDEGATWTTKKPDWIEMPTSGVGTQDKRTISIAPLPVRRYGMLLEKQNILKAASPLGNTNKPYNLANEQGGEDNENTANSYIIGAPGTYRLPLIYGNAIKDGSDNPAAYTSGNATGLNVLKTFVDYNNKAITQPKITGATDATICWQDTDDLVSDLRLEGEYLVFTIDEETIAEGNAVVAILDADGKIMWSWHIWVTDYKSSSDQKVYYQEEYTTGPDNFTTMMNINLGWCSPGTLHYGDGARKARLRFKQVGGAIWPSATGFEFVQNEVIYELMGNSPYYQFGRKDPMLPGIGLINEDKHQSGELKWYHKPGIVRLADAIQNPNVLYSGHGADWCNTYYLNLWSAKYNNASDIHITEHIKTVYDPSPVGYIVPQSSHFTGFTTTGEESELLEELNVAGGFNKGYDFYCGLNGTGPTINIPAVGIRDWHLTYPAAVFYYAGCWSAFPLSIHYSRSMCSVEGLVQPTGSEILRSAGLSMRPVREQVIK